MNDLLPSHELVSSDPLSARSVAWSVYKSAIISNDFSTACTALTITSICEAETASFGMALETAKLSLDCAIKSEDQRRIGYSKNIYGKSLTRVGSHITALKYLHASREIAKTVNDPILLNGSSRNLLIAYSELGDYNTTLLLLLELNMASSQDDPMYESYQKSNIASLYNLIGDHRSALGLARDAFDPSTKSTFPLDYCRMLNGLARASIEVGQFDKSREYSNEELDIASRRSFLYREACALYNLGYSYFKERNLKKANAFTLESLNLHTLMNSWQGIIGCRILLSGIGLQLRKPQLAAEHSSVVIEMGEGARAVGVIGEHYKTAAQIMDQLGNRKQAHKYYQTFCQYDDTLIEFKSNALLLQLSERFGGSLASDGAAKTSEPLSSAGYNQMQILKRIKKEIEGASDTNEKDKFVLKMATMLLDMQSNGALFYTALSSDQRALSTRLLNRFPNITRTELIVCQLLSNGSSSKDIARILAISPETVSKHRAAIRSKLGMKSNITIQAFLLGL